MHQLLVSIKEKSNCILHQTAKAAIALLLTAGASLYAKQPDLSSEKTLYLVGTAHLDTQWNWTIRKTINEYIVKTMDNNFSLFEKYPNYNFSFEGPFRYMLMKEYYPERYTTLSDYIEQGRWHVAGSTLENGDMNMVSPESLIRQALIGNNFFEDEFGKRSTDIYLPDCFGFSYTLPTWASHCGLNGFSTQKLTWGSSVPTPFNIGVWQGPDGSSLIAALNPGAYVSTLSEDYSNSSSWLSRINSTGDNYGVYADYKYFGTGDTGGAPSESSCSWLETSIAGTGPINVLSAGSDDLYNDITEEQKAGLPVYDGELLMKTHGAGCYTSQAAMKRWNRKNELLADSTERASVIADWMGGISYPSSTLDDAWIRFLWHSFHDDLTGTSLVEVYDISRNDEMISQNRFASTLNTAIDSISQGLDTQVSGEPVIVYNSLGIAREDIAETTIEYASEAPSKVKVYDSEGEVPSQIISRTAGALTVAFLADVPSVGFKVYDVRPDNAESLIDTGLNITTSTLENDYYLVTINNDGDISSIWDKVNNRELLSDACRLELLSDTSETWPAWEISYSDVEREPYAYVDGPAEIEIIENGPARVSLQVTRQYGILERSTFIQTISLAAGSAGNQITVENEIDWRTKGTLLKTSFPLTASNANATYDLGMGTIQRGNNTSSLYEVPAQQWADISQEDSSYGISILSDCKYGWDKPDNNTLRLTLLHTPGVDSRYVYQSTQDIGQHIFTYAIAPHDGSWQDGLTPDKAVRINQSLLTYQSDIHSGSLGKEYSFVKVNSSQVEVKAIKKAQRSDEIIIRFQELFGSSVSDVKVEIGNGIASAREVNGCEQDLGDATIVDDKLQFNMTKYQPRTFAITLNDSPDSLETIQEEAVTLPYNADIFSYNEDRTDGDFYYGKTYPAELIAGNLTVTGIDYQIGPKTDGQNNAVFCNGETIGLNTESYDSLYILAASRSGDRNAEFIIDGQNIAVTIQDYHENIVDWGHDGDLPYLKDDTIAWVGTHRHDTDGDDAYDFCYMFQYKIKLPEGASSITLPNDSNIVVFAMTLADMPENGAIPACSSTDKLPYIPELVPSQETRTTNLALDKPVTADGYVSSEVPENAVDSTTADNSKWCISSSSVEPHWLIVDLGEELYIDTFVIKHAGAGRESTDWNTSDFCIQTSPDGESSWTDLICVEGNTESTSTHRAIHPVSTRYVRLYITQPVQDSSSSTAVRIYEFEIYGPCDGTWVQGDISGEDGNKDCEINIYDLDELAGNWLLCNTPGDPDCYGYWQDMFPDEQTETVTYDTTSEDLPDNELLVHWQVQQGNGSTLYDMSGNEYNATMSGTTWTDGWFPQDALTNYSLYFDGSSYARIYPASDSELYNLSDEITISAWFNADNLDGNNRILQKGNSDNQYRLLAERGYMVFDIYNVGTLSTALPTSGVWHHIAGTYDGAVMRLFIDGFECCETQATGSINLTSDPIYVGTKKSGSATKDYFKGYIDDIQIYSVGLTGGQVRTLAQQGQNVPPVIYNLQSRDNILTNIFGSSYLYAQIFDVNDDTMTYNWSSADTSLEVSFSPDNEHLETSVYFPESGTYSIELTVEDNNGGITAKSIDFDISEMGCEYIYDIGLEMGSDINYDCKTDLTDISILFSHWLTSSEDQ